MLENAELTVEGNKLRFTGGDEAFTIFDPKEGVFTIYIKGEANTAFPNGRYIRLWSIPKTFKILKGEHFDQKHAFKAKLEGTEPRKGKSLQLPRMILNCTLEYKI